LTELHLPATRSVSNLAFGVQSLNRCPIITPSVTPGAVLARRLLEHGRRNNWSSCEKMLHTRFAAEAPQLRFDVFANHERNLPRLPSFKA
jgi:hypothetical protein